MEPDRLRILEVVLGFRHPFVTASASLRHRHTVLVGLGSGDVFGWGEAAPFPGVTRETIDDVWAALTRLGSPVSDRSLPPTAAAALDEARWDLAARLAGETSASRLGATGAPVPLVVAMGIAPEVSTLVEWVGEAVSMGVGGVKLKIRPGWDVAPISEIRGEFPELTVSADANGSYATADDPIFVELDRIGLDHLEQPLPADDLAGSAALTARLDTAVCLDESVSSADAVDAILEARAADLVCLKPGRLGITQLVMIHDAVVDHGAGVKISGMLESGIGRAHTLALCGLPGVVAADLAPAEWYFSGDIVTPPLGVAGGRSHLPTGSGIGVVPDPASATVVRDHTRTISD